MVDGGRDVMVEWKFKLVKSLWTHPMFTPSQRRPRNLNVLLLSFTSPQILTSAKFGFPKVLLHFTSPQILTSVKFGFPKDLQILSGQHNTPH